MAALGRGRAHRRPGTERRRRLHLPHAGLRSAESSRALPTALSARTGAWCFDTMTVVARGTWEARACSCGHCADRGRSRARQARTLPTRAAARRDTTSRVRRSAAPCYLEQRGDHGAVSSRTRCPARCAPRHRRPPRKRRAVDLLGPWRRPHSVGARRSCGGLVPALPRVRRRGRSGESQRPACTPGSGDDVWLAGVDRLVDAARAHASEALVVALGVDARGGRSRTRRSP